MSSDTRHRRFSLGRILHFRSKSSNDLKDALSSPSNTRPDPSARRAATEHTTSSQQKDGSVQRVSHTVFIPGEASATHPAPIPQSATLALDIPSPGITRMPSISTGSSYPVTPVSMPIAGTPGYPIIATNGSHGLPPQLADIHLQPPPIKKSHLDDLPQLPQLSVTQTIVGTAMLEKMTNGTDDLGLSSVMNQITSVSADGKPLAEEALEMVEGAVHKAKEQSEFVESVLEPIKEAVEATGVLELVKGGLDSFMEDLPWLMKGLDEVAKLHPFIGGVVIVFKAAYTMEMTRRQNDKRIIALYVAMKDMVSVLVQLRDVKDPSAIGPGGYTIEARMQKTANDATQDIKKCAADCDTYNKKSTLVRVLKGQSWQSKLEGWVTAFASRKDEFQFNLSIHTGNAVDEVKRTTDVMDRKLDAMQQMLLQVLRNSVPQDEKDLASRIKAKGGPDVVMGNDDVLRKLLDDETKRQAKAKADASGDDETRGHDTKTDSRSSYTVVELKNELLEDLDTAVQKNLEAFEGKFAIKQRQMEEDLDKAINEGAERVIDEFNRGPHELINNMEIRAIWGEMRWRLNVKTRLFVMTIRDHLTDISNEKTTSPTAGHFTHDHGKNRTADEWAFQYIGIKYLQPIMEAFDDDGTGYITVNEVNAFVSALPKRISWSLPRWIAYWAIGWQQAAANYCRKILSILVYMHELRAHVLPINRFGVDYYLQKVWKVGFEMCVPLTQQKYLKHLPDWLENKFSDYVSYAEERIRKNLEDVKYDLDAIETVYIVAGPGRIEKNVLPVLYLLLKRDVEAFQHARTEKLNREELWDHTDSILSVYAALMNRHRDLKTLFTQQKLDVEKQFQVFASGMFEHIDNDAALFSVAILANPSSFRKLLHSSEDAYSEVGHWESKVKVLKYDLDSKHPYTVELYDAEPEKLTEADTKAAPHVQAILGQWNGFVYNEQFYPLYFMTSFYLHASNQEGYDFEATGALLGTPYTVRGCCHQESDGTLAIHLVKQHSDKYDAEYLQGTLLPDGSFVGTQGPDEDPATHTNRFILKRAPEDIVCFRPSPREFETNKPRALWKFATQAVHHQVLKRMWSWKYFAQRRDVREEYVKSEFRMAAYGRPLNPTEKEFRRVIRQNLTALDSNFYRSVYEYRQRIVPVHLSHHCDACFHAVRAGARTMCLECQPAKEPFYKSVNLCDHPDCLTSIVPLTQRPELVKPHLPDHDIVRLRSVLQLSEQPDLDQKAKRALKACRELFAAPAKPASTDSRPAKKEPPTAPVPPETTTPQPHRELVRRQTDPLTNMVETKPHHEELTRSQTVPNLLAFQHQHGAENGSANGTFQKKEKSDKKGKKKNAKRKTHGDRFAKFERYVAEAALDVLVLPSAMNRQKICSVCRKGVKTPSWICVDCYYQGVGSFICDDCESKTLLRCIKCEHLYPQPSWYYGSQEEDTFMCNKCDLQYHHTPPSPSSPSPLTSPISSSDAHTPGPFHAKQHIYTHALVRFTLPPALTPTGPSEAERMGTMEEKVARLDTTVAGLDTKVDALDKQVGELHGKLSQLEEYLVRVEAGLAGLLARLEGGSGAGAGVSAPTTIMASAPASAAATSSSSP